MSRDIQFAESLYNSYENYKENSLNHRRFKQSDILALIKRLEDKNIFRVKKVGESVQGREIFLISLGTGSRNIFCWSQMHGDEATATAAIFDIINFFLAENHYAEFKHSLLSNITLHFLPMVNPDGAELFQRRNILEIDLNRDATRKKSPESKILHSVFEEVKPEFGFNLHDQGRDYSAGNTKQWAAISFLAPPFDFKKTVNESRTLAMKLISEMYGVLSHFIPGHISKYKDDYEPRAFGDKFSEANTSIILIESGTWRGDREKMFLRKLNFITMINSFKSIAEGSFVKESLNTYKSIPQNESQMMDFIIRNATVTSKGDEVSVDVGINYEEINTEDSRNFYYKAKIEDIGDLSVFSGFQELDATGMHLELGKTYIEEVNSLDEINKLNYSQLMREGFTNIKLNLPKLDSKFSKFLFNIILSNRERTEELKEEAIPNFILKKSGAFKYAVINGFLLDSRLTGRKKGNALVFD
ncbi:MAG: M14 family zinc carboxypeptidase [Ignavibacteriaceae bacterium]